jgi:hypothetical protein
VKGLFVLLFVFQFATGNVFFAEAAKIPFLLEHYRQHTEQAPNLSFLQFLSLHYQNENHERSDEHHGHLPLHSCGECSIVATGISILPPSFQLAMFLPELPASKKQCFHYRFFPTNGAFSAIFQPPRLI